MFGEIMSLRRASAPPPPPSNAPSFHVYLLPSLHIPFRRRRVSESAPAPLPTASEPASPDSPVPSLSSSVPSTGPDSPSISPSSPDAPFPAATGPRRLSRAHPDTLRCGTCGADLAFSAQIISKCFVGRHGRAYLVAPPSPASNPSCPRSPLNYSNNNSSSSSSSPAAAAEELVNVRIGRPEERQLVTGSHVTADISCVGCGMVVGWKYVSAREPSQQYKVGKFILEKGRVVGSHSWEDMAPAAGEEEAGVQERGWEDDGDDEGVVVFDSEDEDECDDMFAGVWDPKEVSKRRRSRPVNMTRDGSGDGAA
ncbi:hypothetical protein VTK56DRAFT_3525 [Thermocarpiscus australiensis]